MTMNKSKCRSCGAELTARQMETRSMCKSCEAKRYKKYREDDPRRAWSINVFHHHKRKGYTMLLSRKDVTNLAHTTDHCCLCGCELRYSGKLQSNTATLDRVNNDQHLDISNVFIVCLQCNVAKGNLVLADYIAKIRTILKKWGKKI